MTGRPRGTKNLSRPRPVLAYEGLRPTLPIPLEVQERAVSNIVVDEDGHWISQYARMVNGYRQISHMGKVYLAHRASWTYANGPIDQGLVVDHVCFNRSCVNPEHLRLLTISDNSRRKKGADFPLGQCANGHPDSMMREYYWAEGLRRVCTGCLKEKNARNVAKRKAKLEAERAGVEATHRVGSADPESGEPNG